MITLAWIDRFDGWLNSNNVLYLMVAIFMGAIVGAVFITAINLGYYWASYSICFDVPCFAEIPNAFGPQVRLIKFGAASSSFVALVFGSYLALRSYLTSVEVGAFGNRIAHIGFFERFMAVELQRRRAINPACVDLYSIYQLMFPKGNRNAAFAAPAFDGAVRGIYCVVKESSRLHNKGNSFTFEIHRRKMIEALLGLHISMDALPRIDFLEVEDQILDFIEMLCRVFSDPGSQSEAPSRDYR